MEYNQLYNLQSDSYIEALLTEKGYDKAQIILPVNLICHKNDKFILNMMTFVIVNGNKIIKYGVKEDVVKKNKLWGNWNVEQLFDGVYWEINTNYKDLILVVNEMYANHYEYFLFQNGKEYQIATPNPDGGIYNPLYISDSKTFHKTLIDFINLLIEKESKFCLSESFYKILLESKLTVGLKNHFSNMLDASIYSEEYYAKKNHFEDEETIKNVNPEKDNDLSEYLLKAIAEFIVDRQAVATSVIQKHFNMSYDTAIDYVDKLQEMKIIGEFLGSEPRKVYVKNKDQLKNYFK